MSDFYMVCFDVCDPKRLRTVAREMKNFGRRVQLSVFECRLDENDLDKLLGRIETLINKDEDSVRCYPLCPKDIQGLVVDGRGDVTMDPDFHIV